MKATQSKTILIQLSDFSFKGGANELKTLQRVILRDLMLLANDTDSDDDELFERTMDLHKVRNTRQLACRATIQKFSLSKSRKRQRVANLEYVAP